MQYLLDLIAQPLIKCYSQISAAFGTKKFMSAVPE